MTGFFTFRITTLKKENSQSNLKIGTSHKFVFGLWALFGGIMM